jgi:hypothetical protein
MAKRRRLVLEMSCALWNGDEITLLKRQNGISKKKAVKLFLELANGSAPSAQTLARESKFHEPWLFMTDSSQNVFS